MSDSIECPKCEEVFSIEDMELWQVYDEDGKETEINCPGCDTEIIIKSLITGWTFETELNE